MRSISNQAFKTLAGHRADGCVSLFMPADPARLQIRKDTTRLKNLLSEAEKALLEKGVRSPEVRNILEPAESLVSDGDFWRDQAGGLAIFLAPGLFMHFEQDLRFEETLVVAERFHLKPLIPALGNEAAFALLALSQNEVRLFTGSSADSFKEMKLKNVPLSLEEALQYDEGGKQLQHHVVPRTRSGGGAAIYHGHGSMYPDEKENILHFFRKVDAGVNETLRGLNIPLLLAGVDYMRALYENVSQHPALLREGIPGSPDGITPKALFERGRVLVQPYFEAGVKKALVRFQESRHSSRATGDLAMIIPAACSGQVEILLLEEKTRIWGRFDMDSYSVEFHSEQMQDSDDLADLAAVCTKANGGQVYLVDQKDMPDGLEAAAVFYYEVESAH